jgi:hypothetical protein
MKGLRWEANSSDTAHINLRLVPRFRPLSHKYIEVCGIAAAVPPLDRLRQALTALRRTKWYRPTYLALTAAAAAPFLFFGTFFAFILIPLTMILIPYWFREFGVKRYAVNGLILILLIAAFQSLMFTPILLGQSGPLGRTTEVASLTNGLVEELGTNTFRFTVTYTNAQATDAANVSVFVNVTSFGLADVFGSFPDELSTPMVAVDPGDTFLGDGKEYVAVVSLPATMHWFYFASVDPSVGWLETFSSLGPFNTSVLNWYGLLFVSGALNMVSISLLFFLLLGLYWWTRKARRLRAGRTLRPPSPPKADEEAPAEEGEFACTNCGEDVAADADVCGHCGARFEEE